jgi:hypothetical protein
VPAAVDAATVGYLAHLAIELADRQVKGRIEVACTGCGAHDGATADAGDLDSLAIVVLARIALMK